MSRARPVHRFLHRVGILSSASAVLLALHFGLVAGAGGGAGVAFGPNIELVGDPGLPNSLEENESSVAANPRDALDVVAGFKDNTQTAGGDSCYFNTTRDGGQTWTPGGRLQVVPDGTEVCADPSVTGDLQGNFYYAYLNLHNPGSSISNPTESDILVSRSTDGGGSFPSFVVVARGLPGAGLTDKPYIAADARSASKFKGNLYLSYTFEDDVPVFVEGIRVTVSRDGGATWSSPVVLDRGTATTIVEASLPVVAPDGAVYVIYSEFDGFDLLNMKFAKSKDGGKSWSAPAPIASGLPSPGEFFLRNGDPKFGTTAFAGLRANSFPTAAITPDGAVWVAWIDFARGSCNSQLFEPPCDNSDLRLTVSRDGGKNWSAPVKVTDETNASDQFFPWIAAHPNGLVSLVWLDRRLDPANVDYDAFYTNTFDGVTFSPNIRVSSVTSVLGNLDYIGDYIGLAATGTSVFPVWTDRRDKNNLDMFTARGTIAP